MEANASPLGRFEIGQSTAAEPTKAPNVAKPGAAIITALSLATRDSGKDVAIRDGMLLSWLRTGCSNRPHQAPVKPIPQSGYARWRKVRSDGTSYSYWIYGADRPRDGGFLIETKRRDRHMGYRLYFPDCLSLLSGYGIRYETLAHAKAAVDLSAEALFGLSIRAAVDFARSLAGVPGAGSSWTQKLVEMGKEQDVEFFFSQVEPMSSFHNVFELGSVFGLDRGQTIHQVEFVGLCAKRLFKHSPDGLGLIPLRADFTTATGYDCVWGVRITGIVEGTDIEASSDPLMFPFDARSFWAHASGLSDALAEAKARWDADGDAAALDPLL